MALAATLLLRAGGMCRPLASAGLRLRPPSAVLALKPPRRAHAATLAATSVTVRAAAVADRQTADAAPASFGELGVVTELQVPRGGWPRSPWDAKRQQRAGTHCAACASG